MRLRSLLIRSAAAFMALTAVLVLGVALRVRGTLAEIGEQGKADRARLVDDYWSHYLADRETIAQLSWLRTSGGARDAGTYLNSRIPWEAMVNGAARINEDGELAFTRAEAENVLATLGEPSFYDSDPPNSKTDWMARLHDFDVWRLDKATERGAGSDRAIDFFGAPLPDFGVIQAWSVLRLEEGFARRELVSAVADVRALARLLISTETLVGAMVALRLISLEREALAAAPTAFKDLIANVEAVPVEATNAIHRAAWASFVLVDPFGPLGVYERLPNRSVVDCIGIQEGLASAWLERPFLYSVADTFYSHIESRISSLADRCHAERVFADFSNNSRQNIRWRMETCDWAMWKAMTVERTDYCAKRALAFVPGFGRVAAAAVAEHVPSSMPQGLRIYAARAP